MLELIIQARNETERWFDAAPWYTQVLFRPEYQRIEHAFEEMRSLERETRDRTWYAQYASSINDAYDAMHDMVDSGFEFYDQFRQIPTIGPIMQNHIEQTWQKTASQYLSPVMSTSRQTTPPQYRMPTATHITRITEATRGATLEILASTATEELGGNLEEYRGEYYREYVPRQDSYWLRTAVLNVAEAVGSLMEYIFG